MKNNISLLATAVGSLPYDNPKEALDLIFSKINKFPIWPQLSKVSQNEDMLAQFTQNIPGIVFDKEENRWYMDQDIDGFYEKLEEFYLDYESIVNEKNFALLDKYAISGEFSSSIPLFFEKIKEVKPTAIKGQITGPFTWGTSLVDREKKCAFYDETSREIIVKGLTLKALWQVVKFKELSPGSIPVIFMDEPTISQYGTSSFITITKEDITSSISEIADILKDNGALVGVHCCGKTDWSLITDSTVNILNFDALNFAESIGLYSSQIDKFLQKGGYIAWGMIPTLDEDALKQADTESLLKKFKESVAYLTNKGLDEKMIIDASFITPTCGAGGLSIDLAVKALSLTSELSDKIISIYKG